MTTVRPSGEQWTIRHGDLEAVITEVGGSLRTLTAGGADLVAGYGEDEICHHCRGQVLMPWPNRIDGGRYTWDDEELALSLTEPERRNALHGLVAWLPWRLVTRDDASVTVAVRLHPQPGWAWTLDIEATWALADDGLTCVTTATNVGDGEAPFGYGAHPYLTVGEARVDDVRITIPATHALDVDPVRLLPTAPTVAQAVQPVDGTELDLRGGDRLGARQLDIAMTGLPDEWAVRLEGDGRGVELWADAETFPWLQVFTGDALPEPYRRTSGIAVEPLTCPPNAFVTGEHVVRLGAGESWSGTWGLRPC